MRCYYINTDARAREEPVLTCDLWFNHKMAFAGDYANAIWKHSTLFAKLEIGDILFMYESGTGFVGAGSVIEPWDEKVHIGSQRLLYREELVEYRVPIDWFADWRLEPKSAKALGLPVAPANYCEINPDNYEVTELLDQLRKEYVNVPQ